ncbi:hypothetical protein WSM22_39990 [Cytophagales bacterium WSM2-2]|nr:hypothetical protein WSM22_39990 [Cytophagales bacterium WSM2-2]
MKVVIVTFLSLVAFSSASLLYVALKDNRAFDRNLGETRAIADSLTLENDSLGQNARVLQGRVDSLETNNKKLSQSLRLVNSKLALNEQEMARQMKLAEEKFVDLSKMHDSANQLLTATRKQQVALTADYNKLKMELTELGKAKKQLEEELSVNRLHVRENILLESFAQNEKPTAIGDKVSKIVATFSTPMEIKKPSFRMLDPNGKQLTDQDGIFEFKTFKESEFPPGMAGLGKPVYKAELTYQVLEKLGSGIYRIEMSANNKPVGSLLLVYR